MANEEDTRLVAEAKQNSAAYDLLYKKYAEKVFNYFWYRVGHDKETADDLTQETFIKAFQKLSTYEIRGYSYLTYLLKIAHNILINYYRDNKVHDELDSLEEVPVTIKENLDNSIDAEHLWLDVQKLPLLEKEVILLKYRKDMDADEIAKIIGKSENAVNLLLSRARKRLKKFSQDLPAISDLPDIKKPESETPTPPLQK